MFQARIFWQMSWSWAYKEIYRTCKNCSCWYHYFTNLLWKLAPLRCFTLLNSFELHFNPLSDGGRHRMPPPSQIRDWLLSGPEVMTIQFCTYIIRLCSFQGQKLPRKSFRVPFLRQGSFFKINERNISEATELCEGS